MYSYSVLFICSDSWKIEGEGAFTEDLIQSLHSIMWVQFNLIYTKTHTQTGADRENRWSHIRSVLSLRLPNMSFQLAALPS